MIPVLTVLVLAVVVLLLVLPLVRAARSASRTARPLEPLARQPAVGLAAETLYEEREAALEALRELDFDYALGKLAENDYRALRERMELRALTVLKALDELAASAALTADRRDRAPLATSRPSASTVEPVIPPLGAVSASYPARHRNGTSHRPPVRVAQGEQAPVPAPAVAAQAPSARASRRWVVGALLAAALFVLAVAGLYVWSGQAQGGQRAIATLDNVGPRALALAQSNGDTAAAFMATAAGLWASADAGATWRVVPDIDAALRAAPTGNALRAVVSAPGAARVYAAGPELVLRSDDGSRTWTNPPLRLGLSDQPPESVDLRALAVHPLDANVLWAVLSTGVWRSRDGAATWELVSATPPANATSLVAVPTAGAAETAGGTAEVVLYLASATEGVLASADEGRTWGQAGGALSGALPTRRVSSLSFDANSGETAATPDGRELRGTLYAGTDQGVFKTVDRGQLWVRLGLDANVAAVAASSRPAPLLLAVDREGRVYRSTNRGVTWDGR